MFGRNRLALPHASGKWFILNGVNECSSESIYRYECANVELVWRRCRYSVGAELMCERMAVRGAYVGNEASLKLRQAT